MSAQLDIASSTGNELQEKLQSTKRLYDNAIEQVKYKDEKISAYEIEVDELQSRLRVQTETNAIGEETRHNLTRICSQ